MRWLISLVVLLWLPAMAVAERQFWVAVGSFRDHSYAEQTTDRANDVLDASFTISSVDIDANRWYRVMSGPYLSRGSADQTVVAAKQAGFEGTWTLALDSMEDSMEDSSAFAGAVDPGFYDSASPSDGYSSGYSGGYDDRYDELPSYESTVSADGYPDIESLLPALEPPVVGEAGGAGAKAAGKFPAELVDEPPEGYALHKLRRSE
jgi:hypothetical protein